jgi:phosphonate transport system substrate-binding protein
MKKIMLTAAACALAATAAQAEFALNQRYTDTDGDLIADIPTDAT